MKKFTTFCFVLLAALAMFSVDSEQQSAYVCDVPNCATCSYLGVCGLCANNYMLMMNATTGQTYCASVTCTLSNCNTCYSNNTCSVCASGYVVANNGTCISSTSTLAPPTCSSSVKWCLSCASSTSCALCQFGFNLQGGSCYPNYGAMDEFSTTSLNCLSGFAGYMCQFCKPNYMVSPSYACVAIPSFTCEIDNCTVCSSATSCLLCVDGFYKTSTGECSEYECSIEYCSTCSSDTTCSACLPTFELVKNACMFKSYACNVENCAACF